MRLIQDPKYNINLFILLHPTHTGNIGKSRTDISACFLHGLHQLQESPYLLSHHSVTPGLLPGFLANYLNYPPLDPLNHPALFAILIRSLSLALLSPFLL